MDRIGIPGAHLQDLASMHERTTLPGGDETLVQRLRQGLRAGEFRVAFQPVVHAQSFSLLNVECLLRWQHPDYGLLLPECFASAFGDPDTAREVSDFMLQSVCAQLGDMQRAGHVPPRAAINIQPSQLLDETLGATLRAAAKRHKIEPSLLELELVATEDASTLLSTQAFTRPLRQLGVGLALNDFGSGHSPLAILSSPHITTVKLARGFLAHVPASARACVLLTGLLDMLDKLDVTVVAEGVESEAQLRWLRQRPEVYVQGYHVARPQERLASAIALN
jgi:EAL domain-containing protein (putative c-di-GMP-specific phosphodiesterase class I)